MRQIDRQAVPAVLTSRSGRAVVSAQQWEQERRPEIIGLFAEHVYGQNPVARPDTLSFRLVAEEPALAGAAVRRVVEIGYEGPGGRGAFPLTLFVPADRPKPVPACLLVDPWSPPYERADRYDATDGWPVEAIVSRGYAAAAYRAQDLDPDRDDGFRNGVHGVFDEPGRERPGHAWGTIAAWAWGASRALDYLETDPDVDAGRVMLVGHSRGGKTALWAGALDTRFAMVASNNSGCTGAALSRASEGERIHQINGSFPHWFSANYKNFNGKEDELPVDQHLLLAAIAPRALYVASATEDAWADPEAEFASLVLAEDAYRLFGSRGLGTGVIPAPDTPVHGDKLGYHLRTGKHDLLPYDWHRFLDFADRHL